jgi:hypothetical protein
LLQQSDAALHAVPSPAHFGSSHAPLVHEPLQQSPAAAHALPDALHVDAAHFPFAQSLEQQSLDALHDFPSARHTFVAMPASTWWVVGFGVGFGFGLTVVPVPGPAPPSGAAAGAFAPPLDESSDCAQPAAKRRSEARPATSAVEER